MGTPAPTSPLHTPVGQPSGVHSGAGEPPKPPVSSMPVTRVAGERATRVLICMGNAGVRQLIGMLLADVGYAVTEMDVTPWLAGEPIAGPPCGMLILDAWPLRHADAATQARAPFAAQPAALVLLMDSPQPAHLADQLGAVATLPLLITLQDLVSAVQHGSRAQAHGSWGQL